MGPVTEKLKSLCEAKNLTYVGTKGDINSSLVFIGEAPGEEEDSAALPFVGPSGRELDKEREEAGLGTVPCWFTNPYKVRPPENDLSRLDELGIAPELFEEQFWEELEEHKPSIIVACGGVSMALLCPFTLSKKKPIRPRIGTFRGNLLTSNKLSWPHYIIPIYHPAFIFKEYSERDTNIFCLERAKEELEYLIGNGRLQPLPDRNLIVECRFDDVVQYLEQCLASKHPISIDIEMLRKAYVYTIALAMSPWSAISFSFADFGDMQGVIIWRLLDKIFSTKRQIGQNYLTFDACWLESLGFRPDPELVDDTLIRHHVLWLEFKHRLEFQTMQYTREPYYKDEGKTWRSGKGLKQLRLYNAKDAAVTYEIFLEQEKEFNNRPVSKRLYYEYEMPLARKMHAVERKGIATDPTKMEALRKHVVSELGICKKYISGEVGKPIGTNAKETKTVGGDCINIGSPAQVITILKGLGLKVPIKRSTSGAWGESSDKETLNVMFAETNNKVVKEILRIRELNKMLGTYINARKLNDTLYCSYIIAGTVTGRRSSRQNYLSYGTNLQNQPEHSDLAKMFKECLVARPGKIFISCDQSGAEEWPVQALITDLGGDLSGLMELRSGANRHTILAAFIFAMSESECGKGTPQRFIGKKTRHASVYGMQAAMMSSNMAKEGFHVPVQQCEYFLTKLHEKEPDIQNVYHKYVEDELIKNRRLETPYPINRERYFFGIRPYGSNNKKFKEAYSYIPQSTVGDCTGKAIIYCETNKPGLVIMDKHDGIVLETDDNEQAIKDGLRLVKDAYDIELTFKNGTKIRIPLEFEIGYSLKDMVPCAGYDDPGLIRIWNTLHQSPMPQKTSCSGQRQQ